MEYKDRYHSYNPCFIDITLKQLNFRFKNNNNNNDEKTESKIPAAQDQPISTNYFKNKILREEIESKCRLCKERKLLTTQPQDAPFSRRMSI